MYPRFTKEIKNDFTPEELANEIKILIEDYSSHKDKAQFLIKGYSELALVEAGMKETVSPSIYEQLQLGGRTSQLDEEYHTIPELYEAEDDEPPTSYSNPFYHRYRVEPGLFPPKEKKVAKPAEGEEAAKPKQERKPKWGQRGGYSLRGKFSATTTDPEYQYQLRLDRFKRKMIAKHRGDLTALQLRDPILNMTKVGIRNK
jgi:hypothetical protein